ncbi:MAG: hypothetical protein Q9160_006501 [Pyrenula sp. 1 TL-2023]
MSDKAPLEMLAADLFANAAVVSQYCRSTSHPQRSFGQDSPDNLLPPNAPQPLVRAKEAILEAVVRIEQLVQDPDDVLYELLIRQQQFMCISWLVEFQIFSHVPLPPDSVSYQDVAKAAGVPEKTFKSVIRLAMTANFFRETEDRQLAHTTLSASFVTNPDLNTWLRYMVIRLWPVRLQFANTTKKWGGSLKTNETAYNYTWGTDLSFFDHLKANPELDQEFATYMKSQAAASRGTSVDFLLQGFDWASLGEATVVDVGGGGGDASTAIAKVHPKLQFVVQDLPKTIENARQRAASSSLPVDITSRIRFQAHDFFKPQPITNAKIYLLRMIIHDWPDEEAVKILRNLVAVLKLQPGSRIVIMDMALPAPDSGTPRTFEQVMRYKDLTMKQMFNAKEREIEEWYELVRSVDPQLRIVAMNRPEGSHFDIMELGIEGGHGVTVGIARQNVSVLNGISNGTNKTNTSH